MNNIASIGRLSDSRAYAKQIKLMGIAIEKFPGIITITDYSTDEGVIVYASDALIDHLGISREDYYLQRPADVLPNGAAIAEKDRLLLASGETMTLQDHAWAGKRWVVFKYPIIDGTASYLVVIVMPLDDE